VVERVYLCEAYGDCIDLKRAILRKDIANTDMVELVLRGLNVGSLGIFLIKTSKLNGCDPRRLDLGKRLPLCPNDTFSAMKPTQRE